jgi:hypothetical protein
MGFTFWIGFLNWLSAGSALAGTSVVATKVLSDNFVREAQERKERLGLNSHVLLMEAEAAGSAETGLALLELKLDTLPAGCKQFHGKWLLSESEHYLLRLHIEKLAKLDTIRRSGDDEALTRELEGFGSVAHLRELSQRRLGDAALLRGLAQ